MALQLGALRDALEAAGVDPAKARAASEEVAGYERDIAGLAMRMEQLADRIGRLTAVTSVLGIAVIAILISQFALWQQMGRIDGQLAAMSAQLAEIAQAVRR